MALSIDSSLLASFVPIAWAAQAVMIVFLLVGLICLRFQRKRHVCRRERLLSRWSSRLIEGDVQFAARELRMNQADRLVLMRFWNDLHQIVEGEMNETLNRAGRQLQFDALATALARRGRTREVLLALGTLGHLREAAATDLLHDKLDDPRPLVSLAAARALAQIHGVRALPSIISRAAKRGNWPPDRLVRIFQEAGAETSGKLLAETARRLPPDSTVRLLRYLDGLWTPEVAVIVRQIWIASSDRHVLKECLSLLSGPGDIHLIRPYLRHSDWQVRVRAIKTFGRLATTEDKPMLVSMLSDEHWWVRYRAAQALVHAPFLDRPALLELAEGLVDRIAREAILQALAEARQA